MQNIQDVQIIQTIWDDDQARDLRAEQVQEVSARYAGPDNDGVPPSPEPLPSEILLSLLAVDSEGRAVGYIGAVTHAREPELVAELRRLYVQPEFRGQGISRLLLAEAERVLAAKGVASVVLESGTKQPESLSLYESSGYELIENYGFHKESEMTKSYTKRLS